VVAVVSYQDGESCDAAALIEFSHEHLAGYKTPKNILFVESVRRAPNGKADYKWAKKTALAAFNEGASA
jgi:fatty-acyl-CoA synthase